MSLGALLSVEQSDHHELIETEKSGSPRRKWRLVSSVISITKSFWHGVKPQNYIELEQKVFEVNAADLTKVNKNPGLVQEDYGGLECFANALGTDLSSGLTRDVACQREKYGSNASENPKRSLLHFARRAVFDRNILITAVCGMVSLGVGIPAEGFSKAAKEGGSILVAVLIAALFMVLSWRWRNKLLMSMHDVVDSVKIDVVRAGCNQRVPVSDIVVGDLVLLKSGDRVPGHGLVIEQHFLKLDIPMDIYLVNQQWLLRSGTVVVAGFGRMLVTAVGVNEKRRNSGRGENVQSQLEAVDLLIFLLSFVLSVFLVLFSLIFQGNSVSIGTDEDGTETSLHGIYKANDIVNILVTIILTIISIPDPLDLSLMLTKAYATMRLEDGRNAKVFDLSSLETMSYATVICTDKSGVVVTNQIKVSKFWQPYQGFVGEEAINLRVKELVQKGIALNASGCVYLRNAESALEIFGSPTEKAILSWAIEKFNTDVERIKTSHNVTDVLASESCSSIRAREIEDNTTHVHSRGSPELVLGMCSSYYDASGNAKNLDENQMRSQFEEVRAMEESGHTCVAFAHRQVCAEEIEMDKLETLRENLILIGVVSISNPCREGVTSAARHCRIAGVKLKLITEDNILTATAIAKECGILKEEEEEEVLEGTDFQNYSEEERKEKVDSITVMANASPSDKHLMIQCLKQKGHVVVIAGELPTSNDVDIAVSMEIQGASEADILILDRKFASVIEVLKWGRCFYRSIQKFVQFQLTDKIVTLLVSFTAPFWGKNLPLTIIQLLWLSVFTDTLAALAFATLKPTREVLESQPVRADPIRDPLVTNAMLRNVLLQSVYQITVLVYVLNRDDFEETFLFNLFVLFRVFGGLSARELGATRIFWRLHRNGLFWVIFGFSVALQAVFVEIFGKVFDTKRLSWSKWGKCAAIVFLTLPIGWVASLIPVPDKQFFGHFIEFINVKSRIKMHILMKLKSLSTWTSLILIGERNREQPRSGLNV